MIVEIRGTNSLNKGALMMLLAINQELRKIGVDKQVVVPRNAFPYEKRNRYGLHQKLWFEKSGVQLGYWMDKLTPRLFKDAYGLVGDSEIDAVLDASGFAYSDQWGPSYPEATLKALKKWKAQGTKLIFLPQAYGPFTDEAVRRASQQMFSGASAIYARDVKSLEHVQRIFPGKVRLGPDFTNLLSPHPASPSLVKAPVAIIPNARMLDKSSSEEGKRYLRFLERLASRLGPDKGFFLIHEGVDDFNVAERINRSLTSPLEIVTDEDPLVLKWIISECEMLVGARFHGLISGLSQCVPTFGCGWSHKYAELFNDYGVPDMLLTMDSPDEAADQIISAYNNDLKSLGERLKLPSTRIKEDASRLWAEIATILRA